MHASTVVPGGQSGRVSHSSVSALLLLATIARRPIAARKKPDRFVIIQHHPVIVIAFRQRSREILVRSQAPRTALAAFDRPPDFFGGFPVAAGVPQPAQQRVLSGGPGSHYGPVRMMVAEKPPGIGGTVGGIGDAPTATQCAGCEQSGITSAPLRFCGHISSKAPGAAV